MFFWKNKQNKDNRDLEKIIFDIAEYQKDEDFHLLYRLLRNREVFIPIDPSTLPRSAIPGDRILLSASDQVHISYVKGPNDLLFVPACTTIHASILQRGYAGIQWIDFLKMTLKMESTMFGALLQGESSWVAFDMKKISYILDASGA